MKRNPLQKSLPRWIKVAGPFLVLLVIYFLFFNQLITGERIYFHEDIMYQNVPYKFYLATQLKEGAIPLWNPYNGAGSPLFAETISGMFHPLNALFLIFPLHLAFSYFIIAHFLLAGLFMYLFLRSLQMQPIPSLTGSIVFSLSAFFVCHVNHINIMSATVWLPLTFFLIERWRHSRHLSTLLWLVPVLAIQLLVGQPQIVFYSMLAYTLYFLYWSFPSPQTPNRRSITPLLYWLMVLGLSVGLASVQLIPTYELKLLSDRVSPRPEFATFLSYPPWHFLTYVFPNLFGFSRPSTLPSPLWYQAFSSYVNYWELASYVGILPLMLTISAFFGSLERPASFFRGLLLLSFIFMLGRFTPIYTLIATFPPINAFRIPPRSIYLATFSFAVLTSMCIDALTRDDRRFSIERVLVTSLGFCALLTGAVTIFYLKLKIGRDLVAMVFKGFLHLYRFWTPGHAEMIPYYLKFAEYFSAIFSRQLSSVLTMSNPSVFIPAMFIIASLFVLVLAKSVKINRTVFQGLVFSVIVIDLFTFGYTYNVPISTKVALSEPRIVSLFKNEKNAFRIYTEPAISTDADKKAMLRANTNINWGVRSFGIYTSLRILRVVHFTRAMNHDIKRDLAGLMSYANIKYLITKTPFLDDTLEEIYIRDGLRVYQNHKVLPRAFFASAVKLVAEPNEALAALRNTGNDAYTLAVIESTKEPFSAGFKPASEGTIKFVSDDAEKVRLNVKVPDDAFLVFGESYYPGWKAVIDGTRTAIYRTNYLFQGVVVPKGSHTVEFQFQPFSFRIGALISGISFLAFLGLFLLALRRRRLTVLH